MSHLLDRLAQTSTRPRYAFMVLSLIAEVALPNGEAGPFVRQGGETIALRDYLSGSLAPMGARDPRRSALIKRVRSDLERKGQLPRDKDKAAALIEKEVHDRVCASGKSNLSRAVSELVNAGLLQRYYKGFAVDHINRGGQRHAVYVLQGKARCLLANRTQPSAKTVRQPTFPGLFAAG